MTHKSRFFYRNFMYSAYNAGSGSVSNEYGSEILGVVRVSGSYSPRGGSCCRKRVGSGFGIGEFKTHSKPF
jgi:hypothetical protein